MGTMVNHQKLADKMNDLMDHLETLDPDSDEYARCIDNIKQLYSVAEGELKIGQSAAQAKAQNETEVKVQTLKNEAEKDKNSKLLIGTVIGAAITGAVTVGVAQQCRSDEDQGKPWLSKATSLLPKFKGR